jgi:hypothetical protein
MLSALIVIRFGLADALGWPDAAALAGGGVSDGAGA